MTKPWNINTQHRPQAPTFGIRVLWSALFLRPPMRPVERLGARVCHRRSRTTCGRRSCWRCCCVLAHYDRDRGAQSTFLKVVTRSAIGDHRRSSRSHTASEGPEALPDDVAAPGDPEADLLQRITLALVLATLPPQQLQIVALIAEWGSVAEAQRASAQPLCTFYRQLRELRMRLRLAGITPTH